MESNRGVPTLDKSLSFPGGKIGINEIKLVGPK